MKFSIKSIMASALTLLACGAAVIPALAADPNPPTAGDEMANQLEHAAGSNGANLGEPIDPRATVIFLIRAFLSLVGLILLFLFIYAGYLWLTAGGNAEQIETAQGYIKNGVIGLIIVLSAYSITIFAANLARGYVFSTPGFSPFVK